jgi:hypothetical protein
MHRYYLVFAGNIINVLGRVYFETLTKQRLVALANDLYERGE